jgi:HAD superfamily hydrolase (TIGR01484 family)
MAYASYFNRIALAATQGRLALLPDQDGATVMKPIGVHSGFEPETELEETYRTFLKAGNLIAPITGRPEIFFKSAYPNLHDKFWIASEMGARITAPGGHVLTEHPVPQRKELIDRISQQLEKFPGSFVEDGKTCAITIALTHTPDRIGAYSNMLRFANAHAAGNDGIHIKSGAAEYNTHIEFVPKGIDKGSATEFLLNQFTFKDRMVVCIGDTEPDRDMMAVVNDVGGISIGVGPNAPDIAHIVLPDHKSVQRYLGKIADSVRHSKGNDHQPF